MPPTLLRIIRHGVTPWNYDGRIQGQSDIPLAPEGEQQAEILAAYLALEEWDALYSSDLQRARRTAEIIGKAVDLYPIADAGLREVAFGFLEGLTFSERQMIYGNRTDIPGAGVESPTDLADRGMRAIGRVVMAHPGERVLAVAHGALIRAIISAIEGRSFEGPINNTAVADLEFTAGAWRVLRYPDASHLAGDPALGGLRLTGEKGMIAHPPRAERLGQLLVQAGAPTYSTAQVRAMIDGSMAVECAFDPTTELPVACIRALGDGVTRAWMDLRVVDPRWQQYPVLAALAARLRARYPQVAWVEPGQ